MRAIGKGLTASKLLCGILDLPQPPSRINKYTELIRTAVEMVATVSMKTAAEEAIQLNDEDKNVPVAFDGTWQSCNFPTEERNCDKNYKGTSGAAVKIRNRSEKDRNVCCTEFLGDGDSKAHNKKEIRKSRLCWPCTEENGHEHSIPEAVMEVVKPIYRDFAHPDLLRTCLHVKTQNPNESFNNLIWTRLPKNVFVGIKTLQWSVNDAVISFNDGNFGRFKVIQELDISPGSNSVKTSKFLDKVRIKKSQRAAELSKVGKSGQEEATFERKLRDGTCSSIWGILSLRKKNSDG
ncbi:hypothetical protein PR048_033126, partial [Dryococelus australis]